MRPGLRPGAAWGVLCLIALAGIFAAWVRFGRASLEITPAVFPECKGPNIAIHIEWDASSVTRQPVYLLVHKPGQRPTVWLALVPPRGEAETGKWVADGWTIALADSHHRRLAKRTLETLPCSATKH